MPLHRFIVAFLALGIGLLGCSDSTAPDNSFVVTVTVDTPPTGNISLTPNGEPQINCTFFLTAQAKGKGKAVWQGATAIWFMGSNRSVAVDTTSNTAAVVHSAFGADSIGGGSALHSEWTMSAGAPFEATLSFAYTAPNGQTSATSTHLICGPTPDGAVVPTLTQLSVPSTTGEIKIGDTVSVTFAATSSSGIWESIVDVTGGFFATQVIGEVMQTSVNHTVKFVVPNGILPGIPLTLTVRSYDAALVGAAKSINTQLQFVDRTPPTVSVASMPSGAYAVGDTITIDATGTDDNALGWLVYSFGAPASLRDSVPVPPRTPQQHWLVQIPVTSGWVGSPALSVYVRDAAGLTSQVLTSPTALSIYPRVTHPTTSPLSLSDFATDDILYDEKRDLMYVGVPEARVVVFSPSTMTLSAPIALPGSPAGMDLSLSGDSLLVAMPSVGRIAVVDLAHPGAPLGMIKLTALDSLINPYPNPNLHPSGLRIAANGKMIVLLTGPTGSNDQTVEVDLTTGAQRIRTDANELHSLAPAWTRDMGRTNDRSRIYILGGCGAYYDAATDSFFLCRGSFGAPFMGVTVDATGTRLTRGSVVLDRDMFTLYDPGYINGQRPYAAISSDDATLYFGVGPTIRTMRWSDKTLLESIPIPLNAERVFVAPSGAWLLAFQSTNGARVTRVDLR